MPGMQPDLEYSMNDARNATRACPLCGNDAVQIIATIRADQIVNSSPYYDDSSYDRLGVSADQKFGVTQCRPCDFAFTSSIPPDEILHGLYGSDDDLENSVKVFSRPARAAYAFRALSRLLQVIAERTFVDDKGVTDRPIRILDVGCACGVGSLGLVHRHYPYEVVGIEVSEPTRTYLAEQGMTVYKRLDDVPPSMVFDGILLNDVLEHVPNPLDFVSKLPVLSSSRTAIWINVPNFIGWRLAQIVEQMNSGSMDVSKDLNPWEHLSYFSPRSLDSLMNTIGARRLTVNPVDYPIACDTIGDVLKVWIRTMRDVWRIYARRYPQEFTTSGVFVFAK